MKIMQKLGRMMGRSYEETVSILTKGLKSSESSSRIETMVTLGKFNLLGVPKKFILEGFKEICLFGLLFWDIMYQVTLKV